MGVFLAVGLNISFVLSHLFCVYFTHKFYSSGPGSLCLETTIIDVPFGEDLVSGCLLRLGLTELQNCTSLRDTLLEELAKLVPANVVGKRGNANVTVAEDWAPVFG